MQNPTQQIDPRKRELSLRAVLTGVVLGMLLTPSNVYAGLKIGWSFNMSVIALLLGFGFWQGIVARLRKHADWTLHESNINQTVASAAASIVSGGLVAPIPAYTMLTGDTLATAPLIAWVFSVSLLGIAIAWYLRVPLIADAALKFPEGVATLEALTHIYGHGREAAQRVATLFASALLSAAVKWIDQFHTHIPRWAPTPALERLTFTLDPSLLLLGFGGIIGIRVGLSLLAGALLAWGGIAPWLLQAGHVALPPHAGGPQFALFIEWLLWPGVSLMVCTTLASLAVRLAALPARSALSSRTRPMFSNRLSQWQPTALQWSAAAGLGIAVALVVTLQRMLFGIDIGMALLSIPLALCLAVVAARVVGATGIAPIGAIGQLSQLGFGVVAQGQVAVNLMGANTAGGAAGQCTDLMNDFKVGRAIGATPWKQAIAQAIGIAIGSMVGVLVYQTLIPDPQTMLLTAHWPAPAVATWKAVAQTLSLGLDTLAASVRVAILVAGVIGIVLGLLEAAMPPQRAARLPAAAALGLTFILPASVSLMMAAGAMLTFIIGMRWRALTQRHAITVAAGLIAGESITGVGTAFWRMIVGESGSNPFSEE